MWKQLKKSWSSSSSSFLYFFFFFGMVGRRGRSLNASVVWCVDGTPHILRSSVLAGSNNYTAVWNKVCTEAESSYTTYCIKPSGRASRLLIETKNNDKEQWRTIILQGNRAVITTTIPCMFLSGRLYEELSAFIWPDMKRIIHTRIWQLTLHIV